MKYMILGGKFRLHASGLACGQPDDPEADVVVQTAKLPAGHYFSSSWEEACGFGGSRADNMIM
jgi:hypothetical protein